MAAKRRRGGEKRTQEPPEHGSEELFFDKRPRMEERVLLNHVPAWAIGQRVLCASGGWGQLATGLAESLPDSHVTCQYLDLYVYEQALDRTPKRYNLKMLCAADFPEGTFDLAVVPVSRRGESELNRERLQSAYLHLADGGRLVASVDYDDDTWLAAEMGKLFPAGLAEIQDPLGKIYIGIRTGPLKRVRNFACEFVYRDGERLVKGYSRPGVFAHRRLDVGARKLLQAVGPGEGRRILDLGCGSGGVGVALALRDPTAQVHAVDSACRAVQCAAKAAELNGVTITTELSCAGADPKLPKFDLVLANPPYYSGGRLAELFLTGARESLRPGGEVLVVTKLPEWYEQNMTRWFEEVSIEGVKDYFIFRGTCPE